MTRVRRYPTDGSSRSRARARPRRGVVRLVRAGALVLAVGFAVGLPLTAVVASPVSAQTCGPAPAGRVAVAIVVDDGAASPSRRCVEVGQSATGYDVLIAAGHTLRIESGFLCAIDGVPATGCGNRPDFGGAYWRYFHASPGGGWTYSTVGGGGYRMPPRCAIEGWRFATSATEVVIPRLSPPPVTCDTPVVTSPPPTAPPASAVPPGVTGDGPAAGAGSVPGSGGGGAAPAPAAPGLPATTQPAPGVPDTPGTVPADDAATTDGQAPLPDAAEVGGAEQSRTDADGTSSASEGPNGGPLDRESAAASTADRGTGPGSALGLVAALALIGVLGLGAMARSRSRTATVTEPGSGHPGATSGEILSEGP